MMLFVPVIEPAVPEFTAKERLIRLEFSQKSKVILWIAAEIYCGEQIRKRSAV